MVRGGGEEGRRGPLPAREGAGTLRFVYEHGESTARARRDARNFSHHIHTQVLGMAFWGLVRGPGRAAAGMNRVDGAKRRLWDRGWDHHDHQQYGVQVHGSRYSTTAATTTSRRPPCHAIPRHAMPPWHGLPPQSLPRVCPGTQQEGPPGAQAARVGRHERATPAALSISNLHEPAMTEWRGILGGPSLGSTWLQTGRGARTLPRHGVVQCKVRSMCCPRGSFSSYRMHSIDGRNGVGWKATIRASLGEDGGCSTGNSLSILLGTGRPRDAKPLCIVPRPPPLIES